MSTDLQIYTIGHSSHPMGTFLWLLQQHQIGALADIRRYPGSKRHPHFSRANLAGSLQEEGIDYHWLEALGGHRKKRQDDPPSVNRGIADESFRSYADYMATDGFRQGVTTLLEIAEQKATTLMCAEADYRHCHRHLLCDYLTATGVHVQHILPTGEVAPHKLTPGAKIVEGTVTYPGQPTLFDMDEP
jgi:uncharacterized protein (DUF488 family)